MIPQVAFHSDSPPRPVTCNTVPSSPWNLGPNVFAELLQNADDAGSTRVKFVLDCRSHNTISLLGPDMKHFQGPALLVYSDRPFSAEDLRRIQTTPYF